MKNLFLVGVVVLGFAALAKDYHQGFWSMGFNSSQNNMHLLPDQSVCVTTQKTLAFSGVTLDDLDDCDFLGFGCGGYTTAGSAERNYNKARNIQKHYAADGKLDLIVFDIPMRLAQNSKIVKSLTIALENGEAGVMAYVPDGNSSARYATTTDENYCFVTLGADGKRTYQGTAGTLATSPTRPTSSPGRRCPKVFASFGSPTCAAASRWTKTASATTRMAWPSCCGKRPRPLELPLTRKTMECL